MTKKSDREPSQSEGSSAWEVVEDVELGRFDVFNVRRTLARSPRTGRVHPFHIIDLPDWVNTVAFTAVGDVVMVEQFRHGRGEVTLEFASGVIETGEDARAAGRRELEEETGYRAGTVQLAGVVAPNPALQTNLMHVVVARDCTPGGAHGQDEAEDVRLRVVRRADVDAMIARGDVGHALAVAAWYLATASERR